MQQFVTLQTQERSAILDMIWNHSLDQMILGQVLYDENGVPADYLVLDVNPSFEQSQGLPRDQVVGQKITVLSLSFEAIWLEICRQAVGSCLTIKTEGHIALLDKCYQGQVFPLDLDEMFVIVFQEIIPPKQKPWKVKNEQYRWFRDRCQVAGNEKGQPVAVGFRLDMEEEKKTEPAHRDDEQGLEALVRERTRELDESNYSLTQILESITDAFFAVDKQWRVVYWNRAAEEMFACSRLAILGNVVWEVFPEGAGSPYYPQMVNAMEEGKQLTFFIQGLINTAKWLFVRVYPSPSGLTVYAQDITEQRLAAEELRESNDRFQKLFHNSPAAMAIINHEDHRFIDVNSYWEKFMGYSRKEVIGKCACEIVPDKAKWLKFVRELSSKGMLEGHEMQVLKKSGEIGYMEGAAALVQFGGQKCELMVGKDVTNEKQYKSELARLERLNMVGQTAVSIAHEMRNPMTVVRGFIQMMSEKDKYREDKHRLLLLINELDRANSIISSFLSMANNKTINPVPTDVNDIIENLLPLIRADANPKGITVNVAAAKLPLVLLDHNEMRQLILNFTRNACEAMPLGGVLTIRTSVEGEEVVLEVEDQGEGIAPEILETIGTPFMSTKKNGTGIGLALCYSIANRLKGKIEIDTGSKGTTVRIKFKPV